MKLNTTDFPSAGQGASSDHGLTVVPSLWYGVHLYGLWVPLSTLCEAYTNPPSTAPPPTSYEFPSRLTTASGCAPSWSISIPVQRFLSEIVVPFGDVAIRRSTIPLDSTTTPSSRVQMTDSVVTSVTTQSTVLAAGNDASHASAPGLVS